MLIKEPPNLTIGPLAFLAQVDVKEQREEQDSPCEWCQGQSETEPTVIEEPQKSSQWDEP
jgi:hypothetical protein